jgi:hypothetical protein
MHGAATDVQAAVLQQVVHCGERKASAWPDDHTRKGATFEENEGPVY